MRSLLESLNVPIGGRFAERACLAAFFFLATFLGAYVAVPLPFTPVPLTLQTFFVLLGSAWLGRGLGFGVQGLYLACGGAGAAVFAGAAAGAENLFGTTAGYLWAFLPASFLVGTFWKRVAGRGFLARVALLAAADALILLVGSGWLGAVLMLDPLRALALGALPFVPGEIVKILLAARLAPRN